MKKQRPKRHYNINPTVNGLKKYLAGALCIILFPRVLSGCQSGAQKQEKEPEQETTLKQEQKVEKGELIYENDLSGEALVKGWVMEGPGKLEFKDGWMHMYSPDETYHHVFWCPRDFGDNIIVEWEAQNMETDAGLCILFFAAQGVNGEDIFDPSLPERDGDFTWYIKDKLRSYHISYYANTPKKPDRGTAHLRKNNQFKLVHSGPTGIPTRSTEIHQMRLIKDGPHIRMYVDDRKIIDWVDSDENDPRPYYKTGKIGFRQMQWTHFRYRNFKVWSIKKEDK